MSLKSDKIFEKLENYLKSLEPENKNVKAVIRFSLQENGTIVKIISELINIFENFFLICVFIVVDLNKMIISRNDVEPVDLCIKVEDEDFFKVGKNETSLIELLNEVTIFLTKKKMEE